MWNDIKENFNYARHFYVETFLFSLGLFLFFALVFGLSSPELITYLIMTFGLTLIFAYYIGKKNKEEFYRINETIESIRNNKLSSPDEIKLSNNLIEVEGSIKSMFLKTQNDIANLKKLEQVRTEFLGNVSHELRTPIFAIQGFLETLVNGAIDDPNVNKTFLRKAILHTENLSNLLNELIDISMIESGQMRMSFRYFNIREYLEGIVQELQPIAEKKNLVLVLGDVKKKTNLYGDKVRIKQVIVNLIQNAIKYSESGTITVEVQEDEEYGKIVVKDTGIGISEADLDRIFERFYRVDKGRSRAAGGTGLGLAIVKHIVEAHQSKIEVRSKLGFGSEFSFKLKK